MRLFLMFFVFWLLLLPTPISFGQDLGDVSAADAEIPEWDIQGLRAAAERNGWTYTPKESWVTQHLREGRPISQITGLDVTQANIRSLDNVERLRAETNLPKSFSWRELSPTALQPIRNQGSCGSCWAFAVTATIESVVRIMVPEARVNLAEQTFVSCRWGGSCSGGFFTAYDHAQSKGVPTESDDPYRAVNGSCTAASKGTVKVKKWAYVDNNPSTEQIKTAIMLYGPVSVDVNGGFGSYGSGVYNRCGSTGTNHMVTIEGWVDDEQYAANGGGYWLMRNSWGSNWGEDGNMRIVYKSTRGSNCNGIGNYAAFVVLDQASIKTTKQEK